MCNLTYGEDLVYFTREFSGNPYVLKVWFVLTNLQFSDVMLIDVFCMLYDQGK